MSGHGLKVTVKKAKGAFSFVFVATYLVSFLASSFNSVLAKTNLKLPYLNCSLESASLSSINIPAGSAGSSWEWEPGRSQPRMRAPMPWCMLLYILHIYIYIHILLGTRPSDDRVVSRTSLRIKTTMFMFQGVNCHVLKMYQSILFFIPRLFNVTFSRHYALAASRSFSNILWLW